MHYSIRMNKTLRLPRHIIWDWNGTLFNDLEVTVHSINAVLRQMNKPLVTLHQYREVYTHPIRNVYLALGIDISDTEMSRAAELWHAVYCDQVSAATIFDDAREVLTLVKEMGVGQSILSALPHSILVDLIAKHSLGDFFSEVLGLSDLLGRSKIENGQRLLARLQESSNVSPEEILLVGDSTHDLEVAEALGLECALIPRGYESRSRLDRHARPLWQSLAELGDVLRAQAGSV